MKFAEDWLRAWVPEAPDAEGMAAMLTSGGIETSVVAPSIPEPSVLEPSALEVEPTPNRGDCLSIRGLARELATVGKFRLETPALHAVAPTTTTRRTVRLERPEDCPRYCGRALSGCNAGAVTPDWIARRLDAAGIRPLHPMVDITNLVMLELGQPMHAFDAGRLKGAIRVRAAVGSEHITLLDGRAVAVPEGALVIADGAGLLALAGIMGGERAAVRAGTTDLFLESAWFRPLAIGLRARALGIQTDSSVRFERGVDPRLARDALEYATRLMLEIVGGEAGPVIERTVRGFLPVRRPVTLRLQRLERILGVAVPADRVEAHFVALGCAVRRQRGAVRVVPPSWRFDIEREVDLIEEVARLEGYEHLPVRRPRLDVRAGDASERKIPVPRIRSLLVDRDYHEAITWSFVDPKVAALFHPQSVPLALANPISADMAVMRPGLLPGLVQVVLHNLRRQQARVRVFEIGKRFAGSPSGGMNPPAASGEALRAAPPSGSEVCEEIMIAGAVTGPRAPAQWGLTPEASDFFDLRADVEALMKLGGGEGRLAFRACDDSFLHRGRGAFIEVDGRTVGRIGQLAPEVCAALDTSEPIHVFEIALDAVQAATVPSFTEISRFPAIRRDLALVVPEATPAGAVLDRIRLAAGPMLVHLELFDRYQGPGVGEGRKSLAVGLTLQDASRTLKEAEAEEACAAVVAVLEREMGATLRR